MDLYYTTEKSLVFFPSIDIAAASGGQRPPQSPNIHYRSEVYHATSHRTLSPPVVPPPGSRRLSKGGRPHPEPALQTLETSPPASPHTLDILCYTGRPMNRYCIFNIHTLQRKSHFCILFPGIARPQSQFPHSCVFDRFTVYIYFQDRSTYFLQQNRQIDRGNT